MSSKTMSSTLYDILEVIPTASQETIHAAYRSLIGRFHPDKMAALGPEFAAVAETRTREINAAYDILGDAALRARYDEELRREEAGLRLLPTPGGGPPIPPKVPAHGAASSGPAVTRGAVAAAPASGAAPARAVPRGRRDAPQGHHVGATLSAVAAGVALILTLPLAANVIFGAIEYSLTGRAPYFYEADNPADAKGGDAGSVYLAVLWGWLFANYLLGMISYRLAVATGELAAARSGGSFAATNDRLFLFLTFVTVVATGQLLFSAHTMGNMLADLFILAGAYLGERGTG